MILVKKNNIGINYYLSEKNIADRKDITSLKKLKE